MAATLKSMSSLTVLRSPAAERNKQPLLKVLSEVIPANEPVQALEIASGTGQHVCFFAENLPHVTFSPSDIDQNSIYSIQGYIKNTEVANVKDPVFVNTTQPVREWASGKLEPGFYDVILCINMTHISEWESTQGLFAGCSVYLKPGGVLIAYGPYKFHGEISPESNVQFDKMLKQQNSDWGLRDMDDLEKLAKSNAMVLEKIVDMPANNKTAVFRKQ